jgi:hypothetical protein
MVRVSDKKILAHIIRNNCAGYTAYRECKICPIQRACTRIFTKYYEQDDETQAISRRKTIEAATRKYIKLYGKKGLNCILLEALI